LRDGETGKGGDNDDIERKLPYRILRREAWQEKVRQHQGREGQAENIVGPDQADCAGREHHPRNAVTPE
jgi:hypothetical protein